jgi:serine phosphatase RsbU (regulator of sigma subunit)/anti-sigma regulatory factor (Ser/Thr protein kinase)
VPTVRELVFGAEPDAVPKARHFATAALASLPADLVDDVQLLVTELVTNALLHAGPPVTLRVAQTGDKVRLEVEDPGHALPVQVSRSGQSMTGRGLSLVSALSSSWGVDPSPGGGKVVWAELSDSFEDGDLAEPEMDVDALLASWLDDELAEPRYEIRLGALSTELLLAAKGHIDNVIRELTLAKSEEHVTGISLPAPMSKLIMTMTTDFADARAEIKRQAVAASARGELITELVLHLPASAADAGERYLVALDEADRYARAARLLTLAAPRSHQLFRRWYVQSLVDQLRAVSAGEPAPAVRPFSQTLANEVERLSWLEDSWGKLQLLQKVTGELTDASTVTDVAVTVANNAFDFLGAETARVFLLTDDRKLRSLAVRGGDARLIPAYQEFSLDADLPGAIVVRTGKSMFLRNVEQIRRRFPELIALNASERSLHMAPLRIGEHTLGLLSLSFPGSSSVDEQSQVDFVGALADALAQALERALAMQRAAAATERLSFLAEASVALSASLDFEATLAAVTRLLVPRLADWCVVQLVGEEELETVALLHFDEAKVAWARSREDRYPTRMDAQGGAPYVVRTGRSEVYPTLSPEIVELAAVNAEHLEIIRNLGMSSVMVVPLKGRSGVFGVLTLIYAESGRHYAEEDLPFVEDVARRAALALEAADTLREQSGRLADVTRVAEAAQKAILAPPPEQLGPVALAARYLSAAAAALVGGDLYEVVPRPGAVRLLIGDVRGKGLAAVRTATIVLGEFRAAAADISDLSQVAQQIDRRLRPYLADEDFVTALIAEIEDDGSYSVVSCGHPPALLFTAKGIAEVEMESGLPLGLGADPPVATGHLDAGDRLLLYTDGVMEARGPDGRFVDLQQIVDPLRDGPLSAGLDDVLAALREAVGAELGDDIALLVAEYRPA